MGEAVDVSYANGAYVPGGEDLVIVNASRANIGLAVGSYYARQVDAARSAGKRVGHYFFNGNIDPVACARFFVANLHDYRPGDLLAIDCEYESSTGTVAWNPAQALAFLGTVVAMTGAPWSRTAVYINRSIRGQWDWSPLWSKGALRWIASPGADPGDWDIWQYDSAGGLDRNHVRTAALAGLSATPIQNAIPQGGADMLAVQYQGNGPLKGSLFVIDPAAGTYRQPTALEVKALQQQIAANLLPVYQVTTDDEWNASMGQLRPVATQSATTVDSLAAAVAAAVSKVSPAASGELTPADVQAAAAAALKSFFAAAAS